MSLESGSERSDNVAPIQHSLWSKEFWKATSERAIKTFAQALAGLITAEAVGILEATWIPILSIAAMQLVYSVLTSVGSNAATRDGPSLSHAEFVAFPSYPDRAPYAGEPESPRGN